MAGVSGILNLSFVAQLIGAAVGGAEPVLPVNVNRTLRWGPGTANRRSANVLYRATRTLAGGANENLDIRGVLTDAFGGTVNAAEIVAILIESAAANGGAMRVGPAAANGFLGPFVDATDRISIGAGDFALLTSDDGWAVTAGTGDLLNVTNANGAAAGDYTITLVGRTAAA